MAEIYFYHLTDAPLEATLPLLIGRARAAGWRVVVRVPSEARLGWLDARLWQGRDEDFPAHGVAGGAFDSDQPVLLTTGAEALNGAQVLMATDGAEVAVDEVAAFERVCILFDGNDAAALEAARGQWKRLTDAGLAARYWSRESGKWVEKASKNI